MRDICLNPTRFLAHWVLPLLLAVSLVGCTNTQKGAAVGAGAGAAAGGVIGHVIGKTAEGAIVGAIVGGTAGAIIGSQMDKQAEELENELENAEITRVGEGIVVTFDTGLLFDFDSAELSSPARKNLSELAKSVVKYENTDLLIVGHTDNVGTEEYNHGLSNRRADSAAEYLFAEGIQPSRVSTMGKGENDPIASNETEEGRSQNRRVEVVIYASEEYREQLEERHG